MSNSHPLHPFFHAIRTRCAPVAGRCCCNGTIFLPNGVRNCTFQLENLLIAQPRTAAHHLQQLEQSVVTGWKHSDSKSDKIVWTSTIISGWRRSCLEAKAGENLRGGGGCQLWHVAGNCSKTNQEEAKRTYCKDWGEEEDGAQGNSGQGTARVGPAAVSAWWERPPGAVLLSIFGCCC